MIFLFILHDKLLCNLQTIHHQSSYNILYNTYLPLCNLIEVHCQVYLVCCLQEMENKGEVKGCRNRER